MALDRQEMQRLTMQGIGQLGRGMGAQAAMSPEDRIIQEVKMESPGGLATVKKYIETLLTKEKMPIQSLIYLAGIDPALTNAPKAKQYLEQTLGTLQSPALAGMTPKDQQATLESHAKIILDRIVGIEQRMPPTGQAQQQMMGALTAGLGRAVPGAAPPGAPQAPGQVGLPRGYGEWSPQRQMGIWGAMGSPGGMPGTRQQIAGAQLDPSLRKEGRLPPMSMQYMEFDKAKSTYFADLDQSDKAIAALFTHGSAAALEEVDRDPTKFDELKVKFPELETQAAQLKKLFGMDNWRKYDSSVFEGLRPGESEDQRAERMLEGWGWFIENFGPHISAKTAIWVFYNFFFARPEEKIQEEIKGVPRAPYEDIARWGRLK